MDHCFIDKIKGIIVCDSNCNDSLDCNILRSKRAEHVTIDISKTENKTGVGVITQ